MPVIAAVAILGLLIVVHEFGHFMAARSQGIRVSRFSIGFGPVLWSYQGKQTQYALRAIPLGGYVAFPEDEADAAVVPNDPSLLQNRPILDRAIVMSAGVIANLIFAYLLLVIQVGAVGIPQIDAKPGVLVSQVAESVTSAAAQAGFESGDVVVAIDGTPLGEGEAARDLLVQAIENSPNQPLSLTLKRGDQQFPISVTPRITGDGSPKIGVQLASTNGTILHRQPAHIGELLSGAADEFQRIFLLTIQGFAQLLSNFRETAGQVSGPVAIVAIGADIARSNLNQLLWFASLISINLAIINILPLPALDGGQLAFLMLEGVRGKPLPAQVQAGVMQTGLIFLLGLGMVLIVRDTANLQWVQKLLQ